MKNNILIFSLVMLSSCNEVEKLAAENGSLVAPNPSTICSGTTILNMAGTANCSGGGSDSGPIQMLSFASRKDNASFPVTEEQFTAFFAAPARVVATLQDEGEENSTFTDNHSIIPSPLDDSDGRFSMGLSAQDLFDTGRINDIPEKKHYLETIAMNGPITTRADIIACGTSGTISVEARIADCATLNGLWAFYDGKKYGQDGEGDWKLVSVLDNAGTKYEVWRDERTKLLWSDKASADYNWYQAAGYAKGSALSLAESGFDASEGGSYQPGSPISVCPDVVDGKIAAGGGTPTYTYMNPETDFKAGLSHPRVTWRLPSKSDWGLAEVNGIRKVLPNMDNSFWSSSSRSATRSAAWFFNGYGGSLSVDTRNYTVSVRCVASSRD